MSGVPQLNRPHLPDAYFAQQGEFEVEAAVFVEVDAAPHAKPDEARFVAGIANSDRRVQGMVVGVPIDQGAATAHALESVARIPQVKGVRDLLQTHADQPGWALRDAFVEGVRSLAGHGLSFDLCLFHPQLKEAAQLARLCPDTAFVLDHIGKPGIRAGLFAPWDADLKALAALPNVFCKISGVVTEADHALWREEAIAPYLRHAIDCFGFQRVMFGSDWPVSTWATDCARWIRLVDAACGDATQTERRRLFRDNAIAFYRLQLA
jgi:L-fuconolactonase